MKIRIKMRHVIGGRLMDDGIEICSQKLNLIWIPDLYQYFKIHRTNRLMKYEN